MLAKRFYTPTTMRETSSSIEQSQELIRETPKDPKSRHRRRRPLINWAHQRQHRCILLLIALILLQQVEVHTCRNLSKRANERRLSSTNELASSSSRSSSVAHNDDGDGDDVADIRNFNSPKRKRSELTHDASSGQPEEIFTVNDQIESNYDEYPMIVPKRASLLLDRLMAALQHAMEQRKNMELQNGPSNFDNMAMNGYDPTVFMDYDSKDLNSANHGAGGTLMGKRSQRGVNFGGADGVAFVKSAVLKGPSKDILSAASNGGSGSLNGGRVNTGRMYWRCYFNAVSCF